MRPALRLGFAQASAALRAAALTSPTLRADATSTTGAPTTRVRLFLGAVAPRAPDSALRFAARCYQVPRIRIAAAVAAADAAAPGAWGAAVTPVAPRRVTTVAVSLLTFRASALLGTAAPPRSFARGAVPALGVTGAPAVAASLLAVRSPSSPGSAPLRPPPPPSFKRRAATPPAVLTARHASASLRVVCVPEVVGTAPVVPLTAPLAWRDAIADLAAGRYASTVATSFRAGGSSPSASPWCRHLAVWRSP